MSDVVAFTSKKLVMAGAVLRLSREHGGMVADGLRQGFLFHVQGVVQGLLGEILESAQAGIGQPVSLEVAEKLLQEKNMRSGSVQHIRNLIDHGWLGPVVQACEICQQVEVSRSAISHNLIASSESSLNTDSQDAFWLASLQQLVQEIRGQLQEW